MAIVRGRSQRRGRNSSASQRCPLHHLRGSTSAAPGRARSRVEHRAAVHASRRTGVARHAGIHLDEGRPAHGGPRNAPRRIRSGGTAAAYTPPSARRVRSGCLRGGPHRRRAPRTRARARGGFATRKSAHMPPRCRWRRAARSSCERSPGRDPRRRSACTAPTSAEACEMVIAVHAGNCKPGGRPEEGWRATTHYPARRHARRRDPPAPTSWPSC